MLTWKDMETLYERLEADDCIGVYIEIKQYAQHYLKDRQECQKAVEILDQMLSVMDPCICVSEWMHGSLFTLWKTISWTYIHDMIQQLDDACLLYTSISSPYFLTSDSTECACQP